MLLSLVALLIGAALGRLRGGSVADALSTPLRGKGFLVAGIAATLVLNVLEPSQPMAWHLLSLIGYFGFAVSNLVFTGMIVLVIGMLMNLAALLANGAVPVSERALQSIDRVDESGQPLIEGVRESTETADRLTLFGDIVPVPIAGKVVSLGDLIVFVALADIMMNLAIRRRPAGEAFVPDESDDDSTSDEPELDDDELIDLREDVPGRRRPAHAAGHFKLTPPLPRVRRPSHAAEPVEVDLADSEAPDIATDDPPAPTGDPLPGPPPISVSRAGGSTGQGPEPAESRPLVAPIKVSESERETDTRTTRLIGVKRPILRRQDDPDRPTLDLTDADSDPQIDLVDRRPIIDLTVSPTDEQLAEFLRRRELADRKLMEAKLAPPSPGHRRNRSRRRQRTRRNDQENSLF